MGFDSRLSVVTPSQYTKYTVRPMGRMVTSPLSRMLPMVFIIWLLLPWLHESQRHAIGFTDGVVLGAIERRVDGLVALGRLARRRQGPHAERMILGVLRVGVDLGLGVEFVTGLLRQRDHVGLVEIAIEHLGILPGLGAMLFDGQHATGFGRLEEVGEILFSSVPPHPVVHAP